jgi:hypothetical protein
MNESSSEDETFVVTESGALGVANNRRYKESVPEESPFWTSGNLRKSKCFPVSTGPMLDSHYLFISLYRLLKSLFVIAWSGMLPLRETGPEQSKL